MEERRGTANKDGCGAHDAGLPREAATAITYSPAADRQWDATYELGMRKTAAAPAIAMKTPIASASPYLWRQPAQRRSFSSSRLSWSPLGRTPLIALFRCAKLALQARALVQRSSRLTVKKGKRYARHVIEDAFRLPTQPFTP